jgi:KipI family sensor histidine kinase inhibitor
MQRRAVGPAAWLIDDVDEPAAWAAALQAIRLEGVHEIVPAERTVLVVCDRAVANTIGTRLDEVTAAGRAPAGQHASVTIDVVYDGVDLAFVAETTGLDVDEVIERHVNGTYSVAFCGFSPGFAYLTGLDPVLQLDRRATPRRRVPAGSVAIAAAYTSVYPSPSPGGWHLLGRTNAELWDTDRPEPALLVPGAAVRFRRADG